MAAVYTDITIDDLEAYLKRAFRALRPKQTICKSEYCYLLSLSPNVRIQIFTAITRGASSSREVGTDTIKLQLVGGPTNRPLLAGKGSALSMKRTQGWKTTIQDRIEELVELYEDRQDYWEERAGGRAKHEDDNAEDPVETQPTSAPEPERRYDPSQTLRGTFTKDNYGNWAAKIIGTGMAGAKAILETKGGRNVPVVLKEKIKAGMDPYSRSYSETWTIEDKQRQASEDSSVDRLVARFSASFREESPYSSDVGFDGFNDYDD